MTIHLRNQEWLNHNASRDYPLTIEATAQDVTGTFTLPDDFIVAMYLAVPTGINLDPARFFILSIGNYASGFGITIGYEGDETIKVATCNVARAAFEPNTTYRLTGIGDVFLDATGHITLGSLDNIDLQPAGLFVFDIDGARLETDVIRPMIRGITSLRVQNGADLSGHIIGDVIIQAGINQRITLVEEAGEDPIIVFDAIDGEGLNEECVCEDQETPPIRRINGIPGTALGEFTLLGNNCLRITPITNGLRLEDICSEPCCGCKELETVTSQLEQFNRQATTLENFLVRLEAMVTGMSENVLGSRLGDRGCSTCE